MRISTFEAVARALAEAGVRYLVAGGVAVNVHGYQRLTQDLDLVVELSRDNVLAAIGALAGLGYRPVLPVAADDFADPDVRRRWTDERNMDVFSLISDQHRSTTVDLFAREPFEFEEEYRHALVAEVSLGVEARFVRLATLIAMKERTGRDQDRDDVRHLRWIQQEQDPDG